MSHEFSCVVDTNELARSIDNVNRHIDGTTGAVVGMKLAVVAAEKEGADHVCENVNRGFYSLIHSQISQKMAALQSQVDAKLMRLNQQRKQLQNIRARMERDYQMISARYAKIFTSINRALKQRVTELDRPVMNLVTTDASKITNRQNLLMGNVPVGQEESVKVSQRLATSNLKHRALYSIEAITRFIAGSIRLEKMTDAILLKKRMRLPQVGLLAPVIISESNYDNSGNLVMQTYLSNIDIPEASRNQISNRVTAAVHADEIEWSDKSLADTEVANNLRMMVNDSDLDERRKQMIIKLFENSDIKTF